jgi:hypothetical protein
MVGSALSGIHCVFKLCFWSLGSQKFIMKVYSQVFETHLEPADFVDEMHEAAAHFLSQVENEKISGNPLALKVTTDLLSCLVSFSSPTQKLALEKLVQHHVESCSVPSSLPTLFKILRQLKTSNVKLCDAFWSRTLQCMENVPEEKEDYKLFRVTHRLVEEVQSFVLSCKAFYSVHPTYCMYSTFDIIRFYYAIVVSNIEL